MAMPSPPAAAPMGKPSPPAPPADWSAAEHEENPGGSPMEGLCGSTGPAADALAAPCANAAPG
eukprot:9800046-Heterocapsa_arctica.AAC.1